MPGFRSLLTLLGSHRVENSPEERRKANDVSKVFTDMGEQ